MLHEEWFMLFTLANVLFPQPCYINSTVVCFLILLQKALPAMNKTKYSAGGPKTHAVV